MPIAGKGLFTEATVMTKAAEPRASQLHSHSHTHFGARTCPTIHHLDTPSLRQSRHRELTWGGHPVRDLQAGLQGAFCTEATGHDSVKDMVQFAGPNVKRGLVCGQGIVVRERLKKY